MARSLLIVRVKKTVTTDLALLQKNVNIGN